jgi:AcrR family transcriptional regulator
MLVSAVEVLRERGAAGLTIDAVLERSGAPRGSVYHHFPGGRSQLLREALQFAGEEMLSQIDQAADVSAVELLRQIAAVWGRVLVDSNYTAGSPVLAAALGSGQDDQQLTEVAAEIFRHWRTAAATAYARQGLAPAEATALAHTTIAALEGAVVLSRAMRSLDPLNDVAREMEFLIKAREFVAREMS